MNTELFVKVMHHYIKYSNNSSGNPCLLLIDNHAPHLSIEALDLAKESGVTIITLHPHTLAKMQPLDVGVFSPFKCYYNNAMDSWLVRHPGCPVSIYDVGEVIGIAFTRAMTTENITKALKKTGIFPFDRDVFSSDDLLPSTVTDRPNPPPFNADMSINSNYSAHLLSGPINDFAGPSCSKNYFVSPDQFQAPIKAGQRTNKRKSRKLGKSIIATDTPKKNEIALVIEAASSKKMAKQKKVKRQVLQSDSEDDCESVEMVFQESDDNDWYEDDDPEKDEIVLTEEHLLKSGLLRKAQVGEFVVVLFCIKKQQVFYVAKVLEALNDNMEYNVSFLRLKNKSQQQFYMPDVPDISLMKEQDVKFILPTPFLSERLKHETDPHIKSTIMTEKRIHKLRANAFFDLLRENSNEIITLSFDCEKNLVLPKVPDQSAYYSRQLYMYNFTIVQGSSKSKLTKDNVFSYYWTEEKFGKGSNEIASAVFDRLNKIDFGKNDEQKILRLVADGCSGQNKNSTLIGMCSKWLVTAPLNVASIELVFPVTGHSFLPPDRVFGQIERKLRKREVIAMPSEYVEIFSESATTVELGQECRVFDWKTAVK
ncbi:dna-directed rna polymerases i ii and iii subunit rpabc2 [Holotrichia oblita]|uniref:Dna-directed rna polymerases i ii and iii subunit rpabc2 n=1 Tax=Holotrichia oblita TaxID=644536 RepID=A0ACB9SU21_HOLOL|nr:dna-directed rna polymerases i ii and iii subunit rpabc2 [Holotrichia oblita]